MRTGSTVAHSVFSVLFLALVSTGLFYAGSERLRQVPSRQYFEFLAIFIISVISGKARLFLLYCTVKVLPLLLNAQYCFMVFVGLSLVNLLDPLQRYGLLLYNYV